MRNTTFECNVLGAKMELTMYLSMFLLVIVLILFTDRHYLKRQVKKYEEQTKRDNELVREYQKQIKECGEKIKLYYPYYEKHIAEESVKRGRVETIAKEALGEIYWEDREDRKRRIQRIRDAEVL